MATQNHVSAAWRFLVRSGPALSQALLLSVSTKEQPIGARRWLRAAAMAALCGSQLCLAAASLVAGTASERGSGRSGAAVAASTARVHTVTHFRRNMLASQGVRGGITVDTYIIRHPKMVHLLHYF